MKIYFAGVEKDGPVFFFENIEPNVYPKNNNDMNKIFDFESFSPERKKQALFAVLGLGIGVFLASSCKSPIEKRFDHWAGNYFGRKKIRKEKIAVEYLYNDYLRINSIFDCKDLYNKNEFRRELNKHILKRGIGCVMTREAIRDNNMTVFRHYYNFSGKSKK